MRKNAPVFFALFFLLSGCADAIFVSNIPDYLQNNKQAKVVILGGDGTELSGYSEGSDGFADVAPGMPENSSTPAGDLPQPSGDGQASRENSDGKIPESGADAELTDASVSTEPAKLHDFDDEDEAEEYYADESDSDDMADNAAKQTTSAKTAAAKTNNKPAPKAAARVVAKPTMTIAPRAMQKSGAKADLKSAPGSDCLKDENLTKMRSGEMACCPVGGKVCYALERPVSKMPKTAPGPQKPCLDNENLTEMRSGIMACCPVGGEVCYPTLN